MFPTYYFPADCFDGKLEPLRRLIWGIGLLDVSPAAGQFYPTRSHTGGLAVPNIDLLFSVEFQQGQERNSAVHWKKEEAGWWHHQSGQRGHSSDSALKTRHPAGQAALRSSMLKVSHRGITKKRSATCNFIARKLQNSKFASDVCGCFQNRTNLKSLFTHSSLQVSVMLLC